MMRFPIIITTMLALGACSFASATALVTSVSEAYRFCQSRGLAVAEILDPITAIDGPRYVRVVCGPGE